MNYRNLRVFISHAWNNLGEGRIFEFIDAFEEHYDLWIDIHQIKPGDPIRPKIKQGIEWADVVVLLWSKEAADWTKRKDIQFELETAFASKKKIIPCILDPEAARHFGKVNDLIGSGSSLLYLDFHTTSKGLNDGMLRLEQLLIELNIGLMQSIIANEETAKLAQNVQLLSKLIEGLQFILFRIRQGTSGNKASNPALQWALRLLQQLLLLQQQDGDLNTVKYLQFVDAVQKISAAYPSIEQDNLKKQLTIEAIDNIDPD